MISLQNLTDCRCQNVQPCDPRKKRGFTLIELLVVIAIISLLVSILLPSLQKAKALARSAVCISQLRGTGIALALYSNESNEYLPNAYSHLGHGMWTSILLDGEYVDSVYSMICPSLAPGGVSVPANQEWYLEYLTYGMVATYHSDGINVAQMRNLPVTYKYEPIRLSDCWNAAISEVVTDTIATGTYVSVWVFDILGIAGPVQTMFKSKNRVVGTNIPNYIAIHLRHQDNANILFMDFHVEAANDTIQVAACYHPYFYGCRTGELWEFYAIERDE